MPYTSNITHLVIVIGKLSEKKNSEYNENGTKGGGGGSGLNHYLKQLLNSEKGGGLK